MKTRKSRAMELVKELERYLPGCTAKIYRKCLYLSPDADFGGGRPCRRHALLRRILDCCAPEPLLRGFKCMVEECTNLVQGPRNICLEHRELTTVGGKIFDPVKETTP